MNSDFRGLLRLFAEYEVRYLIVGGYEAMHYSQPRFTKDLDLWLEPTEENVRRVVRVFQESGMPLIDVTPADFASEGLQYMVGRSPVLFDFLTSLPGLVFADSWETKSTEEDEGFPIYYLGCEALIVAKTLAGRPQDLHDMSEIERARKKLIHSNPPTHHSPCPVLAESQPSLELKVAESSVKVAMISTAKLIGIVMVSLSVPVCMAKTSLSRSAF